MLFGLELITIVTPVILFYLVFPILPRTIKITKEIIGIHLLSLPIAILLHFLILSIVTSCIFLSLFALFLSHLKHFRSKQWTQKGRKNTPFGLHIICIVVVTVIAIQRQRVP